MRKICYSRNYIRDMYINENKIEMEVNEMEDLLVKIGQMLDDKIEKQIGKLLDEKLDAKLDAKFQEFSDNFDVKLQNLSDSFDVKLQNLSDSFDVKLQKLSDSVDARLQNLSDTFDAKLQILSDIFIVKMQQMSDDFNSKIEELRQDMLEQFFLFECEYGDRIVAIGDSALLDNQKNVERSEKMHDLEERMNRTELKMEVCQNDIFKLKQQVK